MTSTCLVDGKNLIGECCFQDPRDNCIYWTDIETCKIMRRDLNGEVTEYVLPGRAGFVLPLKGAGFVVGFSKQIVVADERFHNFSRIADIEINMPETRINDAAVDGFGGIVFGTFNESPGPNKQPICSVYRLSPDGNVKRLFGQVAISNGIDFSPDGTLMYFADTQDGIVRRFIIFDKDFNKFEEITPLASRDCAPGLPDGGCVDAQGNYWSARVWGYSAVRFSPEGKINGKVKVPVKGPTCVTLGGPELKNLYITSLRVEHTEKELQEMPQSGGLFMEKVDVSGIEQRLCGLNKLS